MCHEYREIALKEVTNGESRAMEVTTERKAFSALQHGLCNFLGFGCDGDDKEGMAWVERAAHMGSEQARALVYRLQTACQGSAPGGTVLIRDWLAFATAQGSRIAYEDLASVDPIRARSCRESYLASNFGDCGRVIELTKDSMLKWHHMQDANAFRKTVLSRIKDEAGEPRTVSMVDEGVDGHGHSLLHYACALGYETAITTLLQNNADVNKRPMLGETALGYACRCGRSEIAYTLLRHGANAGLRNYHGTTAMHYLVYLDIADVDSIAEKMVENNADVNAISMPSLTRTDFVGEEAYLSGTPLHWAIQQNRPDVVRVLLRLGADPLLNEPKYTWSIATLPVPGLVQNEKEENSSPMHLAASLYRADILEAIVAHAGPVPVEGSIPWLYTAISTDRTAMMSVSPFIPSQCSSLH
jgi:hypothetical protein